MRACVRVWGVGLHFPFCHSIVSIHLQVQNSKLSERLREKNHRLERQEEKIRQLEEDKDAYTG